MKTETELVRAGVSCGERGEELVERAEKTNLLFTVLSFLLIPLLLALSLPVCLKLLNDRQGCWKLQKYRLFFGKFLRNLRGA